MGEEKGVVVLDSLSELDHLSRQSCIGPLLVNKLLLEIVYLSLEHEQCLWICLQHTRRRERSLIGLPIGCAGLASVFAGLERGTGQLVNLSNHPRDFLILLDFIALFNQCQITLSCLLHYTKL